MATKTALVERTEKQMIDLLEKRRGQLALVLPAGVNVDEVIRKVFLEVRKNSDLLKCEVSTLFYAIAEAAVNGLQIGGIQPQAYLVPYGREAVLIPSYKGYVTLVRRSNPVETIVCECVREGDEFDYDLGDSPRIRHKPARSVGESTAVTHCYCFVKFLDGAVQRSVWTIADLLAHRDRYSQRYRSAERYRLKCIRDKAKPDDNKLSAWHTEPESMYRKTVIRSMVSSGMLPIAPNYRQIVEREEILEGGRDGGSGPSLAALRDLLEDEPIDAKVLTKPETTEQSPSDSDPPAVVFGGIGCEQFDAALAACSNLGEVSVIYEAALEQAQNDDERAYVRDKCEQRSAQIRAERSAEQPAGEAAR